MRPLALAEANNFWNKAVPCIAQTPPAFIILRYIKC